MARTRKLPLGTITQADNVTSVFDLQRKNVVFGYFLELTGALVTAADETVRQEAPMSLIKSIRLRADGTDLQVWNGMNALYMFNLFMNGTLPERRSPVGTTATSPNVFRATSLLFTKNPRSGFPRGTYLDSTRFRTLQLLVTWGSVSDVVSTTVGVRSLSGAQLHVTELSYAESAESVGGPFSDLIVNSILATQTAASSAFEVQLPREYELARALVRVSDASTGFVLSNALLNEIVLKPNVSEEIIRATFDRLRSINQSDYSISQDYETPGTGFRVQGWVVVDLVESGTSDFLDARALGLSQLSLFCDVDANTRLDVYPIQVRSFR